jgi:secreted trypsin-like serine protease
MSNTVTNVYATDDSILFLDAPRNPQILIIGFGNTEFEGKVSPTLQEVESNVVSAETCVAAYEKVDVVVDPERMLCTGVYGGGKESCQGIVRGTRSSTEWSQNSRYACLRVYLAGDSGGPVFAQQPDGSLVLAATISWGKGCARYARYRVAAASNQHS